MIIDHFMIDLPRHNLHTAHKIVPTLMTCHFRYLIYHLQNKSILWGYFNHVDVNTYRAYKVGQIIAYAGSSPAFHKIRDNTINLKKKCWKTYFLKTVFHRTWKDFADLNLFFEVFCPTSMARYVFSFADSSPRKTPYYGGIYSINSNHKMR